MFAFFQSASHFTVIISMTSSSCLSAELKLLDVTLSEALHQVQQNHSQVNNKINHTKIHQS
jgi:hypothetical protein